MIWTYSDCNGKNTDDVNLAQYKLTGKFYADCEALCKLMNIKVHPALRPVLWEKEKPLFEQEDAKVEEKEVEVVKFDKHRIDKNSMKVLFHCLPVSQVKTLKF